MKHTFDTPSISIIDTANVIRSNATVTVHCGASFEAVGTHSISSVTFQISVLVQSAEIFWSQKQKAWAQQQTRLSSISKINQPKLHQTTMIRRPVMVRTSQAKTKTTTTTFLNSRAKNSPSETFSQQLLHGNMFRHPTIEGEFKGNSRGDIVSLLFLLTTANKIIVVQWTIEDWNRFNSKITVVKNALSDTFFRHPDSRALTVTTTGNHWPKPNTFGSLNCTKDQNSSAIRMYGFPTLLLVGENVHALPYLSYSRVPTDLRTPLFECR